MSGKSFYMGKKEFDMLTDRAENEKPEKVIEMTFRGFSFRQGRDTNGNEVLFPDAVYSKDPVSIESFAGAVIIENNDTPASCPNPPGYPTSSTGNASNR